jgi:hypothetical protein
VYRESSSTHYSHLLLSRVILKLLTFTKKTNIHTEYSNNVLGSEIFFIRHWYGLVIFNENAYKKSFYSNSNTPVNNDQQNWVTPVGDHARKSLDQRIAADGISCKSSCKSFLCEFIISSAWHYTPYQKVTRRVAAGISRKECLVKSFMGESIQSQWRWIECVALDTMPGSHL